MQGVLGALVLAACVTDCSGAGLHDPLHPRFLSASDAADRISFDFGGMVAASHPDVTVGHPHCPPLVDVSAGHMGRCIVPVTGGEMRVDIGATSTPNGVSSPDTLIVRSDAEPKIAVELERAGIRSAVRCPGPSVRVVPNGTEIRCTLVRPTAGRRWVDVRFAGYDDLSVARIWKPRKELEPLYARSVTAHTDDRAVIDGARFGEYLRATAGANAHAELARRGLIRSARCPARIILTPDTRATCSVQLGDTPLLYDLRFDRGRGVVVSTDKVTLIVATVRERAQRYYTHGLPLMDPPIPAATRVRIDCGMHAVALLTPGESLPCAAFAGDKEFDFGTQLVDSGGTFAFVNR